MAAESILANFFSVADLRRPGALRALGAEFDRHALLRPARVDNKDPARQKVDSAADAMGEGEPRLDPNRWQWWFYSRPGAPQLSGTLQVEKADEVHDLGFSWRPAEWFDRPERLDTLFDVVAAVGDAMGALYGRAALGLMYTQRNNALDRTRREPGKFGARLQPDLGRELPDVYWLNYFGPGLVQHWGGRLDTLGVKRLHTPGGAVLVQATETPFVHDPAMKPISAYPFKQPFYEALGFDTFMSETQSRGEPGQHVPAIEVHRKIAAERG
ncbi:MAG TPA: hypothetical protein VN193_12420 [Candidatus Angelobacter sp.]|jgi:hypothetical protein|nr:hypothetical protein [Candidatus Angelobacter sp.]